MVGRTEQQHVKIPLGAPHDSLHAFMLMSRTQYTVGEKWILLSFSGRMQYAMNFNGGIWDEHTKAINENILQLYLWDAVSKDANNTTPDTLCHSKAADAGRYETISILTDAGWWDGTKLSAGSNIHSHHAKNERNENSDWQGMGRK